MGFRKAHVTLWERAMPAIQVAFDKAENIAGMARSYRGNRGHGPLPR